MLWYESPTRIKEISTAIFHTCGKEIAFNEGALERVILRTQNYALAFGWIKNEPMIREYLIKNIEQEVKADVESTQKDEDHSV